MALRDPISYYLPRLTDAGLGELAQYTELIKDSAPKFYAWLCEILVAEHSRRKQVEADADEPADVKLPDSIDFLHWTGQELGKALRHSALLTYQLRDKSAGELADEICRHVSITAEVRLLEWDKLRAERDELKSELRALQRQSKVGV